MSNMNMSIRSRIREDYLTCPICFCHFNVPKALPCLHTFCLGCLRDYVNGRNYEAEGKFPCPVCRKDTEIPTGGVNGLPDNHMVTSLMADVESGTDSPEKQPAPSGHQVHPTKPVPAPRTISPRPIPAPRSPRSNSPNPAASQASGVPTNDPNLSSGYSATGQGPNTTPRDHNASPKPMDTNTPVGPVPQGPQSSGSGEPGHTQAGVRPGGIHAPGGIHPPQQFLNIGAMISDGIGGVTGAVGSALTDISNYLQAPKAGPAPSGPGSSGSNTQVQGSQVPEPMTPEFEFVPRPGDVPGTGYGLGSHGQVSNQGDGGSALYPHLSLERPGPCSKNMLLCFGRYGAGVDLFLKPIGLAVGQGGEFIITDKGGNRVFVFTNSGALKWRFNTDCVVNDVCVTKDNKLLLAVSQSGSSIMRLYTMEGRCLQKIGEHFKFDQPSGIAVTPSNHVAVTNIAADNVLVFTAQRKFSVKFGWKGRGEKHFMQPRYVTATSKDYILVSDTGNNCLKLYDVAGNFKRSFGSHGSYQGQLDMPMGVACDADDNVIVADSNNFRVQVFTIKGAFYTTLIEGTNQIQPDVKPVNVAVTPNNNVAVLLYGTGFAEVRIFSWRPSQGPGI